MRYLQKHKVSVIIFYGKIHGLRVHGFESCYTSLRYYSSQKQKVFEKSLGDQSEPLIQKIKDIFGIEPISLQEDLSEASDLPGNWTPRICENTQWRLEEESPSFRSEMENIQIQNSHINNLSQTILRIVEIVRSEDGELSLERRLEESGISFSSGIVEKVLRRCFKSPHLGFKFFKWVKNRPEFKSTTDIYNAMLIMASEAKELNLVNILLKEMERESCPKDYKTWTILITYYGLVKQIGKVLMVVEKMKESGFEFDRISYASVVAALCNAGEHELAMEFYNEMVEKNLTMGKNKYQMLMTALSKHGDIMVLRSVKDDMVQMANISEEEAYLCMLKSFCVSGRIQHALEIIDEIKKKYPSKGNESYEILVRGFCREGKFDEALEICNSITENNALKSRIYGIIINGYLKKNDASKAFQVLEVMKQLDCLPTISTYTQIIQHLFQCKEYRNACEYYKEMLENGLEPDIVVLTAMVAGHTRHGYISEAWLTFNSIKNISSPPTWNSCSVFIKELCKASRPDEAYKVLDEMWKYNVNAGEDMYRLVISSLLKIGDLEKAEEVKKIWAFFKLDFGTQPLIIPSTSNHQEFREFENKPETNIASEVNAVGSQREGYRYDDLQEICRILSVSNTWDKALEGLEESGIQFTPDLVIEVLRNFQNHGQVALRFFSWVGMQDGFRHTTETFNMAIKISGSGKDFKYMRQLYNQMRRKGLQVKPNTVNIMIVQYGRAGLTEIALKRFEEMKDGECEPNTSTYKYLIMFLCERKGRKVEKAIEIFKQMIQMGFRPDRELSEIYLNALCGSGKLSEAKRCVESLCKTGFTVQLAYSLLIRALCRAGRLDEALDYEYQLGSLGCIMDQYIYSSLVHGLLRNGRLEDALDKVDEMKKRGFVPNVHVFTSLIVHFLREKQIKQASEIYQKMEEQGIKPTVVTYSAWIRGFMNVGMISDAWNVFNKMKLEGPLPDFETYSLFISCLCRCGRSEEGMKLIDEMLENGMVPSTVNFRTVFFGLNREGKRDLAQSLLRKKWGLARRRKMVI